MRLILDVGPSIMWGFFYVCCRGSLHRKTLCLVAILHMLSFISYQSTSAHICPLTVLPVCITWSTYEGIPNLKWPMNLKYHFERHNRYHFW